MHVSVFFFYGRGFLLEVTRSSSVTALLRQIAGSSRSARLHFRRGACRGYSLESVTHCCIRQTVATHSVYRLNAQARTETSIRSCILKASVAAPQSRSFAGVACAVLALFSLLSYFAAGSLQFITARGIIKGRWRVHTRGCRLGALEEKLRVWKTLWLYRRSVPPHLSCSRNVSVFFCYYSFRTLLLHSRKGEKRPGISQSQRVLLSFLLDIFLFNMKAPPSWRMKG